MATISASWTKVATHSQLQRSSHTVSTIGDTVYVFGGELRPREPRDNDVHTIVLGSEKADSTTTTVHSLPGTSSSPTPRVGSASTTLHDNLYLFSGRGGPSMSPIEESGSLWVLDRSSHQWELLHPSSSSTSSPHPSARSYHALTNDSQDTLYLHAGCPTSGRLSDLWSFSLSDKTWTPLADAPGPPRGGTSIAYAAGRIFRLGGFDGEKEIGGKLDIYDIAEDAWSTREFVADGQGGPGARSVAALVPVVIEGQVHLVSLFGESDPSSLGHMGAGKMLADVWVYGVEEGRWRVVRTEEGEEAPRGRGWFGADVVRIEGREALVVVGGLGEGNERLDDAWVLKFPELRR